MRKKWLSILLIIFIILFVGCGSKSDDVKKDISIQDDLLEIGESVLEIEEAELPDDDEKIENIHENLQDDREVDTRDYSEYLKKVWMTDGWAGPDAVIRFISFVIIHIENGEVKGYLNKDNGWVCRSYFKLNDYDKILDGTVEFHGRIYEGIAECEYIDKEGENGKFTFTMFDSNRVEVVLDEDETQSYLLVPYNISGLKFYADSIVIEEVEMDSWGRVNLFYAVLDDLHPRPWILFTNEQGDILYDFWAGFHNGSEVKEVIIEDMNGDGLKDVEIVTYFGDPEGYRFEWYFYQGENGLFSLERTEYYEPETIEICVGGFNMKYIPQDRNLTIDDFRCIELGESIDEIKEKIGEPDGWIGCGILQPVYILEDRRAVLCHFSLLCTCEDLKELVVYNGSNIDCIFD